MRLDGRDPNARQAPLALGLIAIAAVLLWWMGGDDPAPAKPPASTVATAGPTLAPSDPSDPSTRGPGVTHEASGPLDPPPEDAVAPSYAAYDDAEPEPNDFQPPPVARPTRALPPGTSEDNARVLRRLPHSPHDRSPIGGIGTEGLHIDRITMGTSYHDGACSGPVGKFSIEDDRRAQVCFRAVHRRVKQHVIVRWERNGTLVRRTFVTIGDGHAYRTRAALPLRRKYHGMWTVRIMTPDGVELASQSFQVLR